MTLPLKERKEVVKTHPRVKHHDEPTACTALTSARSSVSTHYAKDPDVRKAKQDKARCKNVAHWKFKSLPKSWSEDGDYCWSHLIHQGLMGDMQEESAFERWYTRKYLGEAK